MTSHLERIGIQTTADRQLLDITPAVRAVVARSGVGEGRVFVNTLHTTTAITVNEGLEDLEDDLTISRMKVITGKAGKHIGQEAIQLHGGIGMTAEYAVGHYTARLTEIEHSLGDTRYHLGRLAARVKDYGALDLVG